MPIFSRSGKLIYFMRFIRSSMRAGVCSMLYNVSYSAWCVPSENMRAKYDQDTAETFCYLQQITFYL